MWMSSAPASLSLDFANTLAWRGSPEPAESLTDVSAALAWIAKAASADKPIIDNAKTWAEKNAAAADDMFAAMLALREAIYRAFAARAAGEQPAADDLRAINAALAKAPPRHAIGKTKNGFGWVVETMAKPTAPTLIAPVLWSAGDLLVSDGARIRQCANEKCLWLFIDESRNGARRWCDMSSCGNRAKAARHYRKSKMG